MKVPAIKIRFAFGEQAIKLSGPEFSATGLLLNSRKGSFDDFFG